MPKSIAHSLAVLMLTLLAGTAVANPLTGFLPKSGPLDGRTLIVTSNSQGSAAACGRLGDVYSVIVISIEGSGAPIITKLVVPPGTILKLGDRFNLSDGPPCLDNHTELTMTLEVEET